MHLRPAFTQTDPARIAALIAANPFGVLVTHGLEGMDASHVPFSLRSSGEALEVEGHLAVGNRQCAAIAAGAEGLAIFSGPHAYIAPGWYRAQPSVPTWDYCAVHLHGPLQPLDDAPDMVAMLDTLAGDDPHRFTFATLPPDYADRMMRGIRGFRLRAARVEAQWKLSQNRSVPDRQGVIAALRAGGQDDVAALIAETLPPG
jgi:transcriptional regulator